MDSSLFANDFAEFETVREAVNSRVTAGLGNGGSFETEEALAAVRFMADNNQLM